jgi:S1/P1 Nuclease
MLRIVIALNFLICLFYPTVAPAWEYQGHRVVGSIADHMLNANAKQQVAQILGFELSIAGPWADCVKSVQQTADGKFHYTENAEHPEYETPCKMFRTDAEQDRMEKYVERNWSQCEYKPDGVQRGCHNTYHFDDIAIQRDAFDPGYKGTNNHDLVAAIRAAIAVLSGKPVTPPLPVANIADKKEALFMLAHFVGDLHQPLHVGSVYLDENGGLVDPDAAGAIDPKTETNGGNSIREQNANFHTEWDEIAKDIGEAATAELLVAAKSVPPSLGSVEDWPAAWASDSVMVSRAAFEGASFARAGKRWTVTFEDRDAYMRSKDAIQRQQLAKAGARLAELLNAVWP